MSLKVSQGRKITAVHANKTATTICELSYEPIKYSYLPTSPIETIEQLPAFNLCWYQNNDDELVVYFNTQGNPNNIVYLNNQPVEYCNFGYTVPSDSSAMYNPPNEIEGEGVPNASYLAAMTIDTTSALNPIVRLVREFPLSECEVSSDTNLCEEVLPVSEGEDSSSTEDSDVSSDNTITSLPSVRYTFAELECIKSIWPCAEIIGAYPIGKYEDFNVRQIHHGLILANDSNTLDISADISSNLIADSDIDILNLHTIELPTEGSDKYITLYESACAFSLSGQFDRLKADSDTYNLASGPYSQKTHFVTPLLYQGNISVSSDICTDGGTETQTKNDKGIFLKYGRAEEYYILNDRAQGNKDSEMLSGVELYPVVIPQIAATRCNLTIGCLGNNSECTTTIMFEHPNILGLTIDDIRCTDGCFTDEDYMRIEPVDAGDLIFTISKKDESATHDGTWEGEFKSYRKTVVEGGSYICVPTLPSPNFKETNYVVIGPELCVKTINDCTTIPQATFHTGTYTVEWCGTMNSYIITTEDPNRWDIYVPNNTYTAGDYIEICSNVINGPEIELCLPVEEVEYGQTAVPNGLEGSIEYINTEHKWLLKLNADLDAITNSVTSDIDVQINSGDYINVTGGDNNYTVNGPEMELSVVTVVDPTCTTPQPSPINGQFDYSNNKWTLTLSADIESMTGGGGIETAVSAGDYIKVNESATEDGNKLYTIDGPNICIAYYDSCDISAEMGTDYCSTTDDALIYTKPPTAVYDKDEHKWNIKIAPDNPSDTVDAGDYLQKNGNTINGPEITIACTSTVCGTATYTNNKWELSLCSASQNGVCVAAGDYITVNHTTANNIDTYTVCGAAMAISKAVGIDAAFMYFNGTWMLGLCVDSPTTYSAGNYITIGSNNAINGASIAIGTSGNVTGNATHNANTNTWTLNLNAPTSPTYSAGDYITIDSSNHICGANVKMGTLTNLTGNVAYDSNANEFTINLTNSARWVTNFSITSWTNYAMTYKIEYSDGSSVVNTISRGDVPTPTNE